MKMSHTLTFPSTKKQKQVVFPMCVCVCVCVCVCARVCVCVCACAHVCWSFGAGIQLTLEQHRFELRGSTYMWIFFNKHTGKIFGDLQQFEKLTGEPCSLEI